MKRYGIVFMKFFFVLILLLFAACSRVEKIQTSDKSMADKTMEDKSMKGDSMPDKQTGAAPPVTETAQEKVLDLNQNDLNNVDAVEKDLGDDGLGDLDSGLTDIEKI